MSRDTIWIVGCIGLLVGFGVLALATGSSIWWSVFGIVVAAFGVYWWVLKPRDPSDS